MSNRNLKQEAISFCKANIGKFPEEMIHTMVKFLFGFDNEGAHEILAIAQTKTP